MKIKFIVCSFWRWPRLYKGFCYNEAEWYKGWFGIGPFLWMWRAK